MRILLFGEYSGFFNCLKDGLIALGHDVFLVSNGDAPKDFPSDFRYDNHLLRSKKGSLKTICNICNLAVHYNSLVDYDVVLLIAPNIICHRRLWINRLLYEFLLKNNKKVYLSGAGLTAHLFDYWYDSNEKYRSYMEGYFVRKNNLSYYHNKELLEWEAELMDRVDGYIPIWYEYYMPFKNFASCRNVIRIPVNVNKFKYSPNVVKDKIVFYHGSRDECKGTRYIIAAFDRMQRLYGDKAEFISAGLLPFNDYMKLVDRTNVIVDDANSYSVAMNGFFSMLKGKLVMGGAEPVANKMYEYNYNPVFNICPDVDQICETIISIIKRKDEIEEIGLQGRKFVEEYHDYIKIAKQYELIFRNDLEK